MEVMKMGKTAKIYYRKEMFPRTKEVDMKDYVLVSTRELAAPDREDSHVLEDIFGIYNWIDPTFQPDSLNSNFNRNGADHTSMSVGDIVDIDGKYYHCEVAGWREIDVKEVGVEKRA